VADPIRFYMDEHVPTAVTVGLRLRDVNVLTAQEADMLAASDREHLALAVREGRVLFTQDADFLRLHARDIPHSGIAYARSKLPSATSCGG
jgi:predicted nuclease of predicted toxin-antitoxin system